MTNTVISRRNQSYKTGYYDAEGNFHPFDEDGYFDSEGIWHSADGEYGYYDEKVNSIKERQIRTKADIMTNTAIGIHLMKKDIMIQQAISICYMNRMTDTELVAIIIF